jgi:hypothetical protein
MTCFRSPATGPCGLPRAVGETSPRPSPGISKTVKSVFKRPKIPDCDAVGQAVIDRMIGAAVNMLDVFRQTRFSHEDRSQPLFNQRPYCWHQGPPAARIIARMSAAVSSSRATGQVSNQSASAPRMWAGRSDHRAAEKKSGNFPDLFLRPGRSVTGAAADDGIDQPALWPAETRQTGLSSRAAGRSDHRHDAGLDWLGQFGPSVDHRLQVGFDGYKFRFKCAAWCAHRVGKVRFFQGFRASGVAFEMRRRF